MFTIKNIFSNTNYIIYKISNLHKSKFFILSFFFFSYQHFSIPINTAISTYIFDNNNFCINILIILKTLYLFLNFQIRF